MPGLVSLAPVTLPDGTTVSGEDYAATQQQSRGLPAPRGALGEIAAGVKKGAMVDIPQMAGQALKAFGAPGVGQSIVDTAQANAQNPDYQLHPDQHNAVTNALAGGASMVPAVAGLGALNMIPVVGTAAAAGGAAALFGGSTYQDTYEQAKQAGASDSDAQSAALKAGAIMGVGGAVLQGVAGGAAGLLKGPAVAAAEGFAGPAAQAAKGTLVPALKAAGLTTAEVAAVNAAQTGGVRAVQQGVGIDPNGQTPMEAALESVSPSLGLAALLGPIAALHARGAQMKLGATLDRINDTTADPAARMQAVNDIAPMVAASPPRGSNAQDWSRIVGDWRLSALEAANNGGQIDLSPTFSSEWAGKQAAAAAAAKNQAYMDQFHQGVQGAQQPEAQGPLPQNPVESFLAGKAQDANIRQQQAAFPPEPAAPSASTVPELPPEVGISKVMEGITAEEQARKAKQGTADTDQLHGQVKDALTAAGIAPTEPQAFSAFSKAYRKTAFQPTQDQIKQAYAEHQRDVMRQNADALEAHENKPPEPVATPADAGNPASETPATPEPKTAEQVARERAAEPVANNQLGTKLGHALAQQDAERTRQAQLDQMAAQAETARQTARDAAAVPGDGRGYNAKALGEQFDTHTQANDLGLKGQARGKAKMALDTAAKTPLLADQIKSLEASRDAPKQPVPVKDALDSFITHLKGTDHGVPTEDAPAKPQGAEHESAGEKAGSENAGGRGAGNEGTRAPEPTGSGEEAGRVGKAEPVREKGVADEQEHPALARAQDTRDTLDATVASFKDRLKAGEKLSDPERQRMEESTTLRTRINEVAKQLEEAGNAPDDKANAHRRASQDAREQHLEALLDYARETEKPWTTTRHFFEGDPNARSNGVMMALVRNKNVQDMLGDIASMTKTPWIRTLAERLQALNLNSALHYSPFIPGANPRALGLASLKADGTNAVHIRVGGESEHVVLHEIVHVASARMISLARDITTPKTQREAQLKQSYLKLEEIRKELKGAFAPEQLGEDGKPLPIGETDKTLYGLTNAHEFIAELNTNSKFQDFLRKQGTGPDSIWQRVLQAIDGLLGTKLAGRTNYLDQALSLQGEYFRDQQAPLREGDITHAFETSTGAAARTVDDGISRVFAGIENVLPKASFTTANIKAFKFGLYASSVHHIVDMAKRVQAFKGGFSDNVETVKALNELTQRVHAHVGDEPGKFAMGLERRLAALKGGRQAVEGEMGAIGKMASAFNVDPAKNFADNLKANASLDPKNKAIIDDLHGRYAAFVKAHPDFVKDIKAGEQIGRKSFVNQMAGLARNILHMSSGDMAAREERVRAAQEKLTNATAAGKGVEAAQREHDEAVQAVAHAKENVDALTRHDAGLDVLDPKLAEAGKARLATMREEAKTPEAKAAVERMRGMFRSDDAFEMHQRVEDLLSDAAKLSEGNPLRSALAGVSEGYHSQIDNPYLHLGRGGTFFHRTGVKDLSAQDKAKIDAVFAKHGLVAADLGRTQDHSFAKFETYDEAQAFDREMKAALGDKLVDPAFGSLSDNHTLDNKAGVSDALRQLSEGLNKTFGDVEGLTDAQRDQIKDSFTQQLMGLLPESSAAKATMIRKGTPGYAAEYVRSFARRANDNARTTASGYTVRDYAQTFHDMRLHTEDLAKTDQANQVKAQSISDELGTRHANSMQPNGSSVVQAINGFGFSFYLGASPAFVIRNAMQVWHLGLPVIGGKFGFVKTSKALAVSSVDAYKILQSTIKQGLAGKEWRKTLEVGLNFEGLGLTKPEQQLMQDMVDSGVIMSGQTNQINQLMGPVGNHTLRDAVRVAGMFADYSEKFNRLAAGLAAFRLAGGNNDPASAARASKYARDVVESTMVNYETHNTARALGSHAAVTGQATPLLSQFAKYNFGVLEMVHNLMHDALGQQHDGTAAGKAAAKQAQKEAVKTMAGLAATTTLLAGVMGLPFVTAFAGLYNLLQDKDDPQDVRIQIQSWLAKVFGKGVGEVISHGVPRAAGVDFSPIGLQDILPGSGLLADRSLMKDKLANNAQEMLGPAINGGMNIAVAMQKMSDGYYMKGLEQMLPTALKNLAKSYGTAEHGFTDSKGNPLPVRATPIDSVIQAFGLRPSAKAVSDEQNQAFNEDNTLRAHRRDVITDHLYKAYSSKDPDAIKDWEAQRNTYNAKNPTEPIRKIDAFRSQARGNALANVTGTGIKPTGKQSQRVAERYAIGNTGN